jgi:ADP-ribose pyrophosphatase YjhB (NUDIX family)
LEALGVFRGLGRLSAAYVRTYLGEHSREALVREIREEVGAEIERIELLGVIENLFIYEGEQGHEVVFVYDAKFCDGALYSKKEIPVYKSEIDLRATASWYSPEELAAKGTRLVPEGLADLIG